MQTDTAPEPAPYAKPLDSLPLLVLVERAIISEAFVSSPEVAHRWLLGCLERGLEEVRGVLPEWQGWFPDRPGPADGLAWAEASLRRLRRGIAPTDSRPLWRPMLAAVETGNQELQGAHRSAFHAALAAHALVTAVDATPPHPTADAGLVARAVDPLLKALVSRGLAATMRTRRRSKDWTEGHTALAEPRLEAAALNWLRWRLADELDAANLSAEGGK